MERDRGKEVDNFFKDAMQKHDQHIDYRETDWDAMEQMLDENRRRPVVIWMRVAGGIAAMLVLFVGWWLFKPQQSIPDKNKQQQAAIIKTHNDSVAITKGEPVGLNDNNLPDEKQSITGLSAKGVAGRVMPQKHSPGPVIFATGAGEENDDVGEVQKQSPAPVLAQQTDKISTDAAIDSTEQPRVLAQADTDVQETPTQAVTKKVKTETFKTRPVFTLSVMAAPDINGVSSFKNSKTGSNVGVLLSVNLGNKWTLTTGGIYAVKPYATNYQRSLTYYNNTSLVQQNVMADCRVLDIPLNVDYRVYSKHRNSISVGTGLSSYFMLRENYSYGSNAPQVSISNQNRHILGVLNLQATYQRQLTSKLGVSIQPFYKLPLTNIGYGQVRLQSAGVAAGLNWNIGSSLRSGQ